MRRVPRASSQTARRAASSSASSSSSGSGLSLSRSDSIPLESTIQQGAASDFLTPAAMTAGAETTMTATAALSSASSADRAAAAAAASRRQATRPRRSGRPTRSSDDSMPPKKRPATRATAARSDTGAAAKRSRRSSGRSERRPTMPRAARGGLRGEGGGGSADGSKQRRRGSDQGAVTPSPLPASSPAAMSSISMSRVTLSPFSPQSEAEHKDGMGAEDNDRSPKLKEPQSNHDQVPEGVVDLGAPLPAEFGNDPDATDAIYRASYGRLYYDNLFAGEKGSTALVSEAKPAAAAAASGTPSSPSTTSSPEHLLLPGQTHVNWHMRAVLVDWLVELTHEFRLQNKTLHVAVALLDKAMRWTVVERKMLQCFGCACLSIASKLEESRPPTSGDLVYMSDNAYTRRQVSSTEMSVCLSLEFRLQVVTPFHFVDRFVRASDASSAAGSTDRTALRHSPHPTLEAMTLYLLELAMLDGALIGVKPSLVAASAVYLARATLGVGDAGGDRWNSTLMHYTGYNVADLEETVLRIHIGQLTAEESELKCVFGKYSRKEFREVALKTAVRPEDLGF